MPIGTSPLSTLGSQSGPRVGFSSLGPKLLSGEERQKLGLPPIVTASLPKKKDSLDGSANGLGKDDFLKLLLAQLSNQDPLKPMEDKEFIGQLAQFNTLEQMQQANKHLLDMLSAQSLSQASALLGKQIEASGPQGSSVRGEVAAVTLVDGQPKLTVGTVQVAVADVTKVLPAAVSAAGQAQPAQPPAGGSPSGTTTGTGGP